MIATSRRELAGKCARAAAALALCACTNTTPSPAGLDASPVATDAGAHPDIPASASCASCHPKHVEQWQMSPHAYAQKDPVFSAMIRVGQRETHGELGDFCVKCHSPLGNATGQTPVSLDPASGEYVQPMEGLDHRATDGVSCVLCHSITAVPLTFNANFDISLDGVRRGPIRDPDPSPVHGAKYSELHEVAKVCGGCHMVVNPKDVALELTQLEWVQSIFNNDKPCQTCHMKAYQGEAAVGHRTRDVHDHSFVGVDVSLLPESEFPGYDAMRERAEELLRSSVDFHASANPAKRSLDVQIDNLAGHALPSGATSDREMWIETVVRDGSGGVVFESGTLDEHGDLRVDNPERTTRPGSDPELVLFTQHMYFDPSVDAGAAAGAAADASGRREVDFLWEPNTQKSRLVPVSASAFDSYDLSALPPGKYTAHLRLLFRTFAPHLLRRLETIGGLDPDVKTRVPTVEMAAADVELAFD